MRTRSRIALPLLALLLGAAAATGNTPSPGAKIDPKANQYLREMSKYLSSLKNFSFQVEESFDSVQEDGLKLQFSNQRTVLVSRPDKVAGKSEGDTSNSQFYYDGKTVTVYDRPHKTYAKTKAAHTIDAMLDEMHEKYGVEQPLSDFLFSDPYKVLTEHVQSAAYVGLNHVGKAKCHHLVFQQKLLDWQLWIEEGDRPLPRKLVITFKHRPGEPQFSAYFHRWDTDPQFAEDAFHFTPPAGVQRIDFLHRHGGPPPEKDGGGK